METQDIKITYNKVRNYLKENWYNSVSFCFENYKDKEDIPHITYNGERRNVRSFEARGKHTIFLVLAPYWHEVVLDIDEIDKEELYALLQDVYDNTYENLENGEFEDVFLKKVA